MTETYEATDLDNELTRIAVDIRQMIQDFPVCSTFREIDDLNGLVRSEMDKMRDRLAKLELVAVEQLDLVLGDKLRDQAAKHREQLTSCQRQFRQANVKAMTALESQSAKDLFHNDKLGSSALRQRKDKEQLVAEHGAVTQSLQAISRQLAETVERSRQTVGSIEGTNRTVEEVAEEHRTMSGVIGQSRRLITKYGRREFTDKVLIIFALAFFFAVVLYILRKRLFPSYGPIEVVIYLLGGAGNLVSTVTSLFR